MKVVHVWLLAGFLATSACQVIRSTSSDSTSGSVPSLASDEQTEAQLNEYYRLFPYQQIFDFAMLLTGGDRKNFNTWVVGKKPSLVKAGEDTVMRMNNDTYYKAAFIYLDDAPVYLSARTPDDSRFVSFQLVDERNVNYRNVYYPDGEFTLHYGDEPEEVIGTAIQVPSRLSVITARVEVKNPGDPEDIKQAQDIFQTITLAGDSPAHLPNVDVLSGFSETVATNAIDRLDKTFETIPYRLTVVGEGEEPGIDVPYLYHAAGTKGAWNGPSTDHSAYEAIFIDSKQAPLIGVNGSYQVSTSPPPVDGFWSLTVYDADRGGYLHPNKHDRYHINNTMAVQNLDGTYTFLFKQDCARGDQNCLEVPNGRFEITARYYLPHRSIRTGEWQLPPLKLISTQ